MSDTQLWQSLRRLCPTCFNSPLRKTTREDRLKIPGDTNGAARACVRIGAAAARLVLGNAVMARC
jgi:hypothetical protein